MSYIPSQANQDWVISELRKKEIAESKAKEEETAAASYIFSNFPKYYTGAQTIIYIGDVKATDCVFGVGYRVNIGTTPYYGYASRHFDAVLRGKCLVEGELLIYYNKKKYLWALLSRALGLLNPPPPPAAIKAPNVSDRMIADVEELRLMRQRQMTMVSSHGPVESLPPTGVVPPIVGGGGAFDGGGASERFGDPVIEEKVSELYDKYPEMADELSKMIDAAFETAHNSEPIPQATITIDPSELELAGPFNIILDVGAERNPEDYDNAPQAALRTILYNCFLTGKEKNYYQDDKILYIGYTFFARKEEDD